MRVFNNIDEIKKERQEQRSNPIIYSLLGVLLGELDRLPTRENPTPEQIYTVIKKLHESAATMREFNPGSDQEYVYLDQFIKSQLTSEDIYAIIGTQKNIAVVKGTPVNIGIIMKYFKEHYPGQYDGKLVSQIAKEML
jgi:uncharacterized protein YqeY